jgi:hypothetical protein
MRRSFKNNATTHAFIALAFRCEPLQATGMLWRSLASVANAIHYVHDEGNLTSIPKTTASTLDRACNDCAEHRSADTTAIKLRGFFRPRTPLPPINIADASYVKKPFLNMAAPDQIKCNIERAISVPQRAMPPSSFLDWMSCSSFRHPASMHHRWRLVR